MALSPMIKKCVTCGKEFVGWRSAKYCGNKECRPAKKKVRLLKVCLSCGLVFDTARQIQVCCSPECKSKRDFEQYLKRKEGYK